MKLPPEDAMKGPRAADADADFRMWRHADGIVEVEWRRGITITLERAQAATQRYVDEFGPPQRNCLLIDLRGVRSSQREARTHFARSGAAALVVACALLAESPLDRIIGNFFMRLGRPPYPTRLFGSAQDALEWLTGFAGATERVPH
jgi:hypothetical protein